MANKFDNLQASTVKISQTETMKELCRLCASKCNNMKNIFEEPNKIILDLLISSTDIKFEETDLLPKQVCDECIVEATACQKFKSKVIKSDKLLRNLLLVCDKENVRQSRQKRDSDIIKNKTNDSGGRQKVAAKTYNCEICKRKFGTKRQLIVHNRVHTGHRPYLCSKCGAKFTHLSTFRGHTKLHTGEKPYKCTKCAKAFYTSSACKLHIRRTHCNSIEKEKVDKRSNFCGQSFSSESTLESHITKYTNQMMHKCHVCDKSFSREDHLKSHLRRHTGDRPFACLYCDKKFTQSGVLQTHLTLHIGKKNPCEICGKSFSRPSHLKRHQITHLGTKLLQCSLCDKRFSQKSHLNVHENSHKGNKPFNCNECNISFSQSGSLKRHILTHTGAKLLLCDICGVSYTQPGRLADHKKKVHENGEQKSCVTVQQDPIDCIYQTSPSQHINEGAQFGNQTFELVTEDGQRYIATSLIVLPTEFNNISNEIILGNIEK